ncbi:MAG: twin-arginine translocase subunit TatC [Desulfuromonadales bacterium]|nr:twin-arginine translocase subunit TatC [Desulfuromonadales bacterium]
MSDNHQMPLTSHLEELRKRLIIAGASWLVAFLACYSFAEKLFDLIADPVRQALPDGTSLVFIQATEPFFTYLKIGALAGLLVSLPIIFWQIWSFVAPGLYKNEKKMVIPFVIASSLCFGVGAYFGYRLVFPMAFKVLIEFGIGSGELNAMLSMGSYLSLSSKLLLAFGLVFELPVVIFFLARMGIVDHKMLGRNRKFALLAAFLIGAMLTPPDVFSQTALALPFVILYEIGIIVARFFGKKRNEEETEDGSEQA